MSAKDGKQAAKEGPTAVENIGLDIRPTQYPCPCCGEPASLTHKRTVRHFKCESCGWTFKVNSEDYHQHCHSVETGKRVWRMRPDGRRELVDAGT